MRAPREDGVYTVPPWAFAIGCGVFVAAGVGLFFVFVAMLRK